MLEKEDKIYIQSSNQKFMNNLGILVIDMQEDFLNDPLLFKETEKERLVNAQIKFLNIAREKQIPVFTLEYNGSGRTIPKLKKILRESKSYFVKKNYCGGFNKNEAFSCLLERWRIKNLILTGIYANACVCETTKGAKEKGMNVFTSRELMNEMFESDIRWYQKNTTYFQNLDDLIKEISNPNL